MCLRNSDSVCASQYSSSMVLLVIYISDIKIQQRDQAECVDVFKLYHRHKNYSLGFP